MEGRGLVHRKGPRSEGHNLTVAGMAYNAKFGLEKEFCCTNVTIRRAGRPWMGVWIGDNWNGADYIFALIEFVIELV